MISLLLGDLQQVASRQMVSSFRSFVRAPNNNLMYLSYSWEDPKQMVYMPAMIPWAETEKLVCLQTWPEKIITHTHICRPNLCSEDVHLVLSVVTLTPALHSCVVAHSDNNPRTGSTPCPWHQQPGFHHQHLLLPTKQTYESRVIFSADMDECCSIVFSPVLLSRLQLVGLGLMALLGGWLKGVGLITIWMDRDSGHQATSLEH